MSVNQLHCCDSAISLPNGERCTRPGTCLKNDDIFGWEKAISQKAFCKRPKPIRARCDDSLDCIRFRWLGNGAVVLQIQSEVLHIQLLRMGHMLFSVGAIS